MTSFVDSYGTTEFSGDQLQVTDAYVDDTLFCSKIAPNGGSVVNVLGSMDIQDDLTVHGDETLVGNQTITGNVVASGNITANTDMYTDRIKVGAAKSAGVPSADVHIQSTGPVSLWLEADSDNVTESDIPTIRFTQDGNQIMAAMGIDGNNNFGTLLYGSNGAAVAYKVYTGGSLSSTGSADGVIPTITTAAVERFSIETNGTITCYGRVSAQNGMGVAGDVNFNNNFTLTGTNVTTGLSTLNGGVVTRSINSGGTFTPLDYTAQVHRFNGQVNISNGVLSVDNPVQILLQDTANPLSPGILRLAAPSIPSNYQIRFVPPNPMPVSAAADFMLNYGNQTTYDSWTFSKGINIVDTSNQIKLGPQTGPYTTVNCGTPTVNTTITIPDPGVDSSFVLCDSAQTINGAKTFTTGVTVTSGSNQLKLGNVQLTTGSAPRVYTIVDAGVDSSFVMTNGNQTITGNTNLSGEVSVNNITINGSSSNWVKLNSGGSTKWQINDAFSGINLSETGVADFRVFVNSGGNVTIGGNNNVEKLRVNGTFRATGTGFFSGNVGVNGVTPDRPLTIQGNGGTNEWMSLYHSGGTSAKWSLNGYLNGLNFVESGVDDRRLYIASGGNVGLGNYATSGYKLDVSGNIRATTDIVCDTGRTDAFCWYTVGECDYDSTLLNMIRGGANNYYLSNVGVGGIAYVSWNLVKFHRTTANKGMTPTSMKIHYQVFDANMTSASCTLTQVRAFDNSPTLYVSAIPSGTFTLAVGQPCLRTFTIASPAYYNSPDTMYKAEFAFTVPAGCSVRIYGLQVNYNYNYL